MEIKYCPRCNVPVRRECDICHGKLLTLKFHELGDIKPASKFEMNVLKNLISFKEVRSYLRKRVILMAKQPGLDYRKDVFVDGYKIGTMEYVKDKKWRWKFIPTGKGAALFHLLTGHVDFSMETKGHIKGKRIKREIEGEWAIVSSGECIGVAVKGKNGTRIKDVYCRKVGTRKKSNMETAIRANTGFLRSLEKKAVNYIRRYKPDYVAFSGGKDSEIALYLASKAGVKKAVFANTGLEFPETERFAYSFADYLEIELIEIKPQRDFWSIVDEKGIPTKDNRWCTRHLKLNGLMKLKGTIVDGSRKYESFGRMTKSGTSSLGNLRIVYPILDWLALDVWLFIKWKNLPYNPLYDMGYERIGCYLCPSMLNAEFHNLKKTHPELFRKWYDYLRKQGYSREEIMDGIWRWRELPPKMQEIRKS